MKRAFVLLPLLLAGCGSSSGRDVLENASENVSRIRSGTLHASLLVKPRAKGAKNAFGWRVDGPFTFGDEPTARIRYTPVANGRSAAFVLERGGGYTIVDGQRRDLAASDVAELRRTAQAVRVGASIVDVGAWIDESQATGCPKAHEPVECAKGTLDPAETIAGLAALAQLTGTSGFAGTDQERLRDAVRKATFFVMAGKDDKLLRELKIELDIGDVPQEVSKLAGADVRFELAVDDPKA